MPIRSWLLAALLSAGTCLAGHAAPPPALQPVQDFFEDAEFGGARLSPSGRFLAARVGSKEGRDRLVVVDLTTFAARAVAGFSHDDIGRFQWVNDQRLLFDSTDKDAAPGTMQFAPGLYAVDRDGRNYRELASRENAFIKSAATRDLLPWHTYMLEQAGAQNADAVYVRSLHFANTGSVESVQLLRLDTRNGRSVEVRTPGNVQQWVLDSRGEPRMAITVEKGRRTTWLLENDQWRALGSGDAWLGDGSSFTPLAFDAAGRLYVKAATTSDRKAVHTFDLATGKLSEKPIFAMERHDFSGELIQVGDRLAGIRYEGDAEQTYWFDADLRALQATIDAKLPNMVNLVDVPRRPETPFVLVTTYSDTQPEITLVYNRETGKFTQVGKAYPRIDPAKMGVQEIVQYPARDGLAIPARLTLPAGATRKDKLPMVVLVHGGPWVREVRLGWTADSQFLASRGYAVLEPDFRGSTGYGGRHFSAGLKQWGLAMQDDIADGTRWAIAQGIADPRRVCIAGASYGGYATLMGLIRDPELYRCGVAWAGVTDIRLMYDGGWFNWSDMSAQYIQYGMPQLVGDPVADAAQLQATSPVEQAARLRQPLLMAYGGADRRVPLAHGTRFRDAVRATNSNVEWIEYPEEGHGWSLPRNRIDFWTRVETFLDKHIKQ